MGYIVLQTLASPVPCFIQNSWILDNKLYLEVFNYFSFGCCVRFVIYDIVKGYLCLWLSFKRISIAYHTQITVIITIFNNKFIYTHRHEKFQAISWYAKYDYLFTIFAFFFIPLLLIDIKFFIQ